MRSSGRKSDLPESRAMSGLMLNAPHDNSISPSMFRASRCTAPMKASLPPPTIPILSFLLIAYWFLVYVFALNNDAVQLLGKLHAFLQFFFRVGEVILFEHIIRNTIP